jgi:hypothetical protein
MMEAVRTSETSVDFKVTTRRYIPEEPELQVSFPSGNETKMFHVLFTYHMTYISCPTQPAKFDNSNYRLFGEEYTLQNTPLSTFLHNPVSFSLSYVQKSPKLEDFCERR